MGRKSEYTEELAEEICDRIANGIPLREICRDENMPAWRTVYSWQEANVDFYARIAHARELGEEAISQECLRIADTPLDGVETTLKANGDEETRTGDMLGHRKLQIETRLKLLAKWNPRKWGDKVAIGGAGDLPPIKSDTFLNVSGLSTQALSEIMALSDASKSD